MRIVGAVVGLLCALACALAWLWFGPTRKHRSEPAAAPPAGSRGSPIPASLPANSAAPGEAIETPTSEAARQRADLIARRAPFVTELLARSEWGIVEAVTADDLDTLDLRLQSVETGVVQAIAAEAIARSATRFGFRRVRFWSSPPGVAPAAECVRSETGAWTTYVK